MGKEFSFGTPPTRNSRPTPGDFFLRGKKSGDCYTLLFAVIISPCSHHRPPTALVQPRLKYPVPVPQEAKVTASGNPQALWGLRGSPDGSGR